MEKTKKGTSWLEQKQETVSRKNEQRTIRGVCRSLYKKISSLAENPEIYSNKYKKRSQHYLHLGVPNMPRKLYSFDALSTDILKHGF